jgi:hypothetical protein
VRPVHLCLALELFADVRHERIDQRRLRRHQRRLDAVLLKHPLDGGVVNAKPRGNRSDRPLLSVMKPEDVCFLSFEITAYAAAPSLGTYIRCLDSRTPFDNGSGVSYPLDSRSRTLETFR